MVSTIRCAAAGGSLPSHRPFRPLAQKSLRLLDGMREFPREAQLLFEIEQVYHPVFFAALVFMQQPDQQLPSERLHSELKILEDVGCDILLAEFDHCVRPSYCWGHCMCAQQL